MKEYFKSSIMDQIRNEDIGPILNKSIDYVKNYIAEKDSRSVYPTEDALKNLDYFDEDLPSDPDSPEGILDALHRFGSPATVAQTGGRYFGFVNGSIIPSALPARILADAWDQNAALYVMSPIASKIESTVEKWLLDLLKLPHQGQVSFVTGSSTATFVGVCTARNYLLSKKGYRPFEEGLANLPKVKVVLGQGAHSSVYRALALAGLGSENVYTVPMDSQGRMIAEKLPPLDDLTLVIAQAGHVCSGAFDPFKKICEIAHASGAWVHVDGAFGLWALSDERFNHLTRGLDAADSWSVDGHKTLNTPYDNGIFICKTPEAITNAMYATGSYLVTSAFRDGMMYTPEMSRRARAIDLWSTLKGLGKTGVGHMIYEMHAKAQYFADQLDTLGIEILNDVVFNQVIIRYGSDETTLKLMKKIQESGVLWLGGAKWEGKDVMRISVSSYRTTYEDIDLCVRTFRDLM